MVVSNTGVVVAVVVIVVDVVAVVVGVVGHAEHSVSDVEVASISTPHSQESGSVTVRQIRFSVAEAACASHSSSPHSSA